MSEPVGGRKAYDLYNPKNWSQCKVCGVWYGGKEGLCLGCERGQRAEYKRRPVLGYCLRCGQIEEELLQHQCCPDEPLTSTEVQEEGTSDEETVS